MKKEIGLVLSGGGTKGIAEAGALKFLEEKNIFPEVIKSIHPHPTVSEAIMEAVAAAYGEVIHI